MPDFNKGDFTQQGVAGHVNANLRLNEKRLVNIDLTSNEEAEGCTINGTVKDLLNDKVYGIGSGGGGLAILTATIINETGYDLSDLDGVLKAEYGVNIDKPLISANNTEIKEYLYSTTDDSTYFVSFSFVHPPTDTATIAYSDLVNCTVNQEEAGVLDITNPSENASATLTLTLES